MGEDTRVFFLVRLLVLIRRDSIRIREGITPFLSNGYDLRINGAAL